MGFVTNYSAVSNLARSGTSLRNMIVTNPAAIMGMSSKNTGVSASL